MHWLINPYIQGETATSVRLTLHARQRLSQRTDIPVDEADRFAAQALRYGRSVNNCRGDFQRFLYSKADRGLWPVLYMRLVLLFAPADDGSLTLITVYPQPDSFDDSHGKDTHKQRCFPLLRLSASKRKEVCSCE